MVEYLGRLDKRVDGYSKVFYFFAAALCIVRGVWGGLLSHDTKTPIQYIRQDSIKRRVHLPI